MQLPQGEMLLVFKYTLILMTVFTHANQRKDVDRIYIKNNTQVEHRH